MIVKDEEHVIERCFDNVRHLIDAIVIMDTGSTDKTIELMEGYIKKHNLIGKIGRDKWVDDFGYSRTAAVKLAEEFIRSTANVNLPKRPVSRKEWSTITSADSWYILFMDADNEAKSDDGRLFTFDKDALTEDKYNVKMRQNSVSYDYVWLIKVDLFGQREWEWKGVLHEYVREIGFQASQGMITGGYILSGRTGSRNNDPLKYRKDALIFERALLKEPNNDRYWFYLAQSYRDAGDDFNAVRCYLKRASMGGWHEEVYYSYLEAARLSLKRKPTKAHKPILFLMKAIEAHPGRFEAPYILTDMARQNNLFKMGWSLAKDYVNKPFPANDMLFVDEAIHRWRFYDVAAICAFYAGDKAECKRIATLALQYPTLDEGTRKRIQTNIDFC